MENLIEGNGSGFKWTKESLFEYQDDKLLVSCRISSYRDVYERLKILSSEIHLSEVEELSSLCSS